VLPELAPAARPVAGDDRPEHGDQRGCVDCFAVPDGHGAGGLVVIATGDDPFGAGDDAPSQRKTLTWPSAASNAQMQPSRTKQVWLVRLMVWVTCGPAAWTNWRTLAADGLLPAG